MTQWPENPLVRTSCPPSVVGETSSPFCACWFERLDKMSEKYAKEMILVPKPPEGSTTQTGGQAADEGMAQFWKRRLLVDELAHAPHVDKMMKIMEDMKESEGRALPPSVPDYGLGSSDYFRSQRQLQNVQPRTIKSVFKDTPRSTKTSRTPPPPPQVPFRNAIPGSFQEAVKRQEMMDQDLETFRKQAEADLTAAMKSGNTTRIEKARQRMAIVYRNIDEIKAQDSELDGLKWGRPDKDKQNTYGEDDESLWRQDRRATLQQRQIQRYHQLERMFPQPGMPPPPPLSPRSKDPVSTTRPPVATSFQEAVERDETMEREFEGFRARAQEALTKAEKQGDPKAIKKAQQKRAIVERNIEAIKDQDEQIDQLLIPRPKKQDQMTYGEEDATQRRQETLESLHDRHDKLYHQLKNLFPPPRIKPVQRGQGSAPIVWYKPRGWIEE